MISDEGGIPVGASGQESVAATDPLEHSRSGTGCEVRESAQSLEFQRQYSEAIHPVVTRLLEKHGFLGPDRHERVRDAAGLLADIDRLASAWSGCLPTS